MSSSRTADIAEKLFSSEHALLCITLRYFRYTANRVFQQNRCRRRIIEQKADNRLRLKLDKRLTLTEFGGDIRVAPNGTVVISGSRFES